ncbi:Putative RING-H2 finger protein ATL12 [Striga hermonthica]|uniref:RING-H2 finger protein ATL12 n=1 Tax=Striga hermonthica TaxID=68872 RepID=A0A9N7NA98_STRHE|nr:Putative RING-H2 finger protein ATL12 [Striga hermonthica]
MEMTIWSISIILLMVWIALPNLLIIYTCVRAAAQAVRDNARRDEETGQSERIPGLNRDNTRRDEETGQSERIPGLNRDNTRRDEETGQTERIPGLNRDNTRDVETGQSERIPGLKPDDLESLPYLDYGGPGIGSSLECAVCLESFKAGEKCRVLPTCGHIFHVGCIDSWLLKTGACPICRTSANSDELEVSRESVSGEFGLEMV